MRRGELAPPRGTLLGYTLRARAARPEAVTLVRCGDFYEVRERDGACREGPRLQSAKMGIAIVGDGFYCAFALD
jgi:hypothetical protein